MVTIDAMALDYENMSSVNDSLSNPISIDLCLVGILLAIISKILKMQRLHLKVFRYFIYC